jgi:hypothetical protein
MEARKQRNGEEESRDKNFLILIFSLEMASFWSIESVFLYS